MGGKGKSGPVATNDQMVQMQMQQAAEAKQANIERTARTFSSPCGSDSGSMSITIRA